MGKGKAKETGKGRWMGGVNNCCYYYLQFVKGYCERKACAVHDTQTLTVGNQKAGTPAKGMRNERLQRRRKALERRKDGATPAKGEMRSKRKRTKTQRA